VPTKTYSFESEADDMIRFSIPYWYAMAVNMLPFLCAAAVYAVAVYFGEQIVTTMRACNHASKSKGQ